MEKIKALVIENEYDVDQSIKAFLKDNPGLFESVNEQTFCRNRRLEDLMRFVAKADAIIIASTFGTSEQEQVEEYIDAFLNKAFSKKMKFFIHAFTREVNEWGYVKSIYYDTQKLFQKIKLLVENGHEVYDFFEDPSASPSINDDLNIFNVNANRSPFVFRRLSYSSDSDVFYIDDRHLDKYYGKAAMVEDRNNYISKNAK